LYNYTKRKSRSSGSIFRKNKQFSKAEVELPENELQISEDGTVTIYPHQYGTDGFFISRIKKQ
jgi:tRNA and rRNA cytosine-C5-methylases